MDLLGLWEDLVGLREDLVDLLGEGMGDWGSSLITSCLQMGLLIKYLEAQRMPKNNNLEHQLALETPLFSSHRCHEC